MPVPVKSDAEKFGKLVKDRREARLWTQEILAAEAFGGSLDKGRISRIEKGKFPNITPETVRNIARALEIEIEDIPPSLRWPEAVEAGKDTNTLARENQERLDRLIAAKEDQSRAFGIKEGMLIALARNYAEGNPDNFDAALAGLQRALEVARDERERGRLPSNIGVAVGAVIARIDALNEDGAFEAGQAALEAELNALDDEDERRRAARSRLYEKGVAQAILTRNAANAARFVIAGCDLDSAADAASRCAAYDTSYDTWYERGRDKGLNFDLEVAILLAEQGVRCGDSADLRGRMQNNLGIALRTLGERESGTARLEQAVTAYANALEEQTRARVPLDWAMTQNNLGNALRTLGERESGTARLKQAVTAYKSALKECTRARAPLAWAITQNNLGTTLRTLGERESGTTRLKQAVTAYENALEELTRARVPLDWAMTQHNLGTALSTLGERESGTDRLEQAVTAYESALEEWTRARVPLDWAMTQNNLGTALKALGERESGTARLEQAVIAYENALEERTRARVPLDWAGTQNNLGLALTGLAWRSGQATLAGDAVQHLAAALDLFRDARHAPHAVLAEQGLEKARAVQAALSGGES